MIAINSVTLQLALNRLGIKKVSVEHINDNLKATQKVIVQQALQNNNVTEVFYKVNQKPGKPLWFGYKNNTKIFALPLIRTQMGIQNPELPMLTATTSADIKNIHGKILFLKGTVANGFVTQLTGQASSMLKSFAVCNALLMVPDTVSEIKKGEEISYLKIQ